ncbi:MAG: FtsX-like permease family protein [Bacteroidales bacterium]|jgi:ABC-type lipoprotein release transport system permease subunit|nr:FtsX-like permease family protein [Bacteroidales bacterium]
MIIKIAFKNVWRNKVRSLIVILSVTLGLTGGIFAAAIITGMVEQKVRMDINNEISHIQIHYPGFLKNFEPQYSIPGADSIAGVISKIPDVKAVCTRIRITGMAASPNSAAGVQIVGVDPLQEKKVSTLYTTISDSGGGYFIGNKKNQLVLGRKLVDKLKVRLKSKVVLRFQNTDGDLTEAAFSVNGIYQTANNVFDETTVFVKKKDLGLLTGNENSCQEIAIILNDIDQIPIVEPSLKSRFPGFDIRNWIELRPEMGLITSTIAMEVYIILGIILFALAFGIVNTMLMIVFERTRELGMLMAVGMSRARVFRMIMLETIFLTTIGGIIGMILSAFLVSYFHRQGIDLSSMSKGLEAYGFDPNIYPFIKIKLYFHLTLMIIFTAILSAIMPARKALKLKPVEAIRVE